MWTLAAVIVSVFAVTAHDDFHEYRAMIPLLVAAGFAFSYWRRGKRNWWIKLVLAGLCLQVSWNFLRNVVADPYHTSVPLTILLLWLQTLHSFDVPARRDLLFSLLSSVILMAVAAAFALDLSFLVYLAGFALAAIQALVHNAWQAAQQAVDAGPPVRPGRGAAVEVPLRGVSWAANNLLVLVLVGAGLVFMLTPRFEGMRLMTLPFSPQRVLLDLLAGRIANPAYPDAPGGGDGTPPPWNSRGYFGFSASVDLRLRGRLDDTIVMRVRATRQFNWRGLVFDTYTGTGWKIADPRVVAIDGAFPPLAVSGRRDEVIGSSARGTRVIQSFYVDVEQPNVVFAAPLAELLYLSSSRVYVDRYGSIRLPSTLRPGTVYSVVSRTAMLDPRLLRTASGEAPRFIQERYLQLPALPDRVHALAARLTAGQPTLHDRVTAVNRYLRSAYRYDLSIPPQRRPGDAVDYFLFEERRGYCEQFASAMVVLLRSARIPARLVTGYSPGTLNPVTGLLEVRNSDAHAWVEVFFPGIGWVDHEPAPGFPSTDELGGPATRRWVWLDVAVLIRDRVSALVRQSPQIRRWLDVAARATQGAGLAIALLIAGVVAVAGARAARTRFSARPRSPLEAVFTQMNEVLASETLEEFCARVQEAGPVPGAASVIALVQAAVYGGAVPAQAEIEAARRHLVSMCTRVRRRRDAHR
jgi:transglutaminase-like putative cysteine protease